MKTKRRAHYALRAYLEPALSDWGAHAVLRACIDKYQEHAEEWEEGEEPEVAKEYRGFVKALDNLLQRFDQEPESFRR